MKIKYLKLYLIVSTGLIIGCNNSNNNSDNVVDDKKAEATKTEVQPEKIELEEGELIYNSETAMLADKVVGIAKNSSKVNWVAFKTTEKKPVGGTFDNVIIGGIKKSNQITKAFTGATVSIPVNSINSKNESRDEKLVRAFFGTMVDTEVITADIIEFVDNNGVVIEFVLNGKKQKVTCMYSINKEIFTIDGTINLLDFEAEKSIKSLNTECEALHTGADGVSKLWSEVAIKYTGTLTQK